VKLAKLIIALALLVCAFPVHASDVSLGAGAAYFTQSKGTVPYIEGAYSFTARKSASVTWARDDQTNHAFGALDLRVGEAPFVLGNIYLRLGGGAYWQNFDDWKAELVSGVGVACTQRLAAAVANTPPTP
jgi:hypothetical protein